MATKDHKERKEEDKILAFYSFPPSFVLFAIFCAKISLSCFVASAFPLFPGGINLKPEKNTTVMPGASPNGGFL